MGKIDFGKVLDGKKDKEEKIDFSSFSEEKVERSSKVSSVNLMLKEITPFIDNVRIHYDEDKITSIKDSININGLLENIEVFYIEEGNEYVIYDGHMRYRALTELYGPDFETEVIIKKRADTMTKEIEMELMRMGFVSSNTKSILKIYDNIFSLQKYLEKGGGTSISQKETYQSLGLDKTKAMRYNTILKVISKEELKLLKNIHVGLSTLSLVFKIESPEKRILLLKNIESHNLKSEESIRDFLTKVDQVQEEIGSKKNGENRGREKESGTGKESNLSQKLETQKINPDLEKELKKKLMLEKKPKTAEQKVIVKFEKLSKEIQKILVDLEIENLSEEETSNLIKIQKELEGYFIKFC